MMKFSVNYFTEIKILSFAERKILDIVNLESVSSPSFLFFCNGLVFCFSMAEKERRPDEVVYIDYFYYAKSEKIESIKTKDNILIDVHDFTGVPLFEFITSKIKDEDSVKKAVVCSSLLAHTVFTGDVK